MLACMSDKYHRLSPVEAHTLYDGQLVPVGGRLLLLAGFCRKDMNQFKSNPTYCLLDVSTDIFFRLPSSLSSLSSRMKGQWLFVSASG